MDNENHSFGSAASADSDDSVYLIYTSGVMKVAFYSDLADIKSGSPRERMRRFQERVNGALAAESIKAKPRSLDEVLWRDFDGPGLERDMKAGRADAVERWLDRCGGVVS